MQLRKLSFKIKLILVFEIFFIVIYSILGFLVWKELTAKVRDISRDKLMAIASTTAVLVDGDKHELIQTEDDRNSQNYEEIRQLFEKVVSANPQIADIYTMRKTEGENQWYYVVGSYDQKDENNDGVIDETEEGVKIGDVFSSADFPELENIFKGPAADYETNCDKWGCWLSGYAPIKDREGNIVAALGVDFDANDVVAFEKNARLTIISIFLTLLVAFPLIIYLFLSRTIKPVTQIVKSLGDFSHDLSSRINIKTGDEFEMIANTFNGMAQELQDLYAGLEQKVREKTQKINQERAKDEALLSSIGEGMIATDQRGNIIMANAQSKVILQLGSKEIIKKDYCKVLNLENEREESLKKEDCPIQRTLNLGKKTVSQYHIVRKDGKKLPVIITCAPVIIEKQIIGTITVIRDITEEKQIDRTKSEFVTLASHQLRTPLSSINWYTEMLLDEDAGKLAKKQKRYVEKINLSSRRMSDLVSELLNVSRLEMGTFIISPAPVSFRETISSVLEELEPKILEKELMIEKNYNEGVDIINADPKLLRIIFQNLISNAVKYTPVKGKITIGLEENKNGEVKLRVSDTGYGIPVEQQDKLFTKLFRADNIKTKETDGTGLGLYIVKSIVDTAGGKIQFSSEENKGSVFSVIFPASGMKRKEGVKNLN